MLCFCATLLSISLSPLFESIQRIVTDSNVWRFVKLGDSDGAALLRYTWPLGVAKRHILNFLAHVILFEVFGPNKILGQTLIPASFLQILRGSIPI